MQKVDDSATKALAILQSLLGDYHPRDFTIRFWNGDEWPGEIESRFTLVLNHPDVLRRLLRRSANDLALSEAYIYGELDLEGDMEAAMPLADYLVNQRWSTSTLLQAGWNLFSMSGNGRFGRKGRQAAAKHVRRIATRLTIAYFFAPRIASLAALATRNLITVLAGIRIFSWVLGLIPVRAFRFCFTNLPNPGRTNSPFFFATL